MTTNEIRYNRTQTAVNYIFDRTAALRVKHPELRYGQAIMNTIAVLDPDLYATLVATDMDIFHTADQNNDDKISDFYNHITRYYDDAQNWK